MSAERPPRVVLLVEDNPGDANLVREMLEAVEGDRYRFAVVHVSRMADALHRLGREPVDVVLLDLGLPDAVGIEALTALQSHSRRTPIVVLTGDEDEGLAMHCIGLGAQDYLAKTAMRPSPLRRSISYAIDRSNEREIRDLRETLERYREMAMTAGQAEPSSQATPSLRVRLPQAFTGWVDSYASVLRRYFDRLVVQGDKPRDEMGRIVAELGGQDAGPRDLIDIHVSALNRVSDDGGGVRARTLALEGRLVALEMMGLLVDYYRVRKTAEIR